MTDWLMFEAFAPVVVAGLSWAFYMTKTLIEVKTKVDLLLDHNGIERGRKGYNRFSRSHDREQ